MDLNDIKNLKDMLDFACQEYGETNFIEYKTENGVEHRTYNEFRSFSKKFSKMLSEKHLSPAHVGLIGTTSFEWVYSFFGTANSGGCAVPLAPNETTDMLYKLIEFADVNVLAYKGNRDDLYELIKANNKNVKLFISLDNSSNHDDVINISDLMEMYEDSFEFEPDPDSTAAICFTSGTTGFPKGVMTTHKNYVYTATSVHAFLPTKRMLTVLPIHHSFCFSGNILKSIVNGRTVCVNDGFQNLISDFRLYKPDDIMAVPALIKKFMMAAINNAKQNPEIDFQKAVNDFLGGNMVEIISGGAPLDPELNALFNSTGIKVLNGYGMTECSPIIANNSQAFHRHGSVGRPIPCMELKFDNGEILVRGPSVMKGYYKNEEATKECFTEDGFLHTGDVGYLDDDGYLYITGRCKNLILLDNGENVSAEMLEAKFEGEELISECICYNEGSAICVELFPNKQFIASHNIDSIEEAVIEILNRVNSKLASFQRISTYVIRDIPFEHTASQKIKRDSKLGLAGVKRKIVEPETDSEKKVCNCIKTQLNLNDISVTDNFFAIGGDSLSAMEIAVALNISAQLIYDNPMIRDLANAISSDTDVYEDKISNINAIIKETAHGDCLKEEFNVALLTGSTGFLGVHILKELLDRNIKVFCLVRNEKRFYDNCKYYYENLDLSNVSLVIGNIESDRFGLNETAYESLAEQVDVVFHVAANVHHAGDYSDLKRTNVDGTINVINFCLKANAVLQHTSTVSLHGAATVKQRYGKLIFDEEILDISQNYPDNVYIHSKYVAEQEIIRARLSGLKANIYRIGNLTWRATDGKFQKNVSDNGFLHRVHAILKLGLINENMDKYPTDLTAVDECAKGYVNLALSGAVNEIYHMYNPNFLDTKDMFDRLGVPYKVVSTQDTIETIFANSDDRDLHVYMFYLIISSKSRNIEMDCTKTCRALYDTGFEWSEPTKEYLTVSNDPSYPQGHCLNYTPIQLKPIRKTGYVTNPIQMLTLGKMQDAQIREPKVFQGSNSLEDLTIYIKNNGLCKPMVLTFDEALKNLEVNKLISSFDSPVVYTQIQSDPGLCENEKIVDIYGKNECDCVIALGGGSVIDTAKLLALRVANISEDIDDITKIDSECSVSVPLYIIPTTSGTGSEVTLFAVMTDEKEHKKKPFVSDKFQASAIALYPELTISIPEKMTVYTAIDALTHAIEAYTSSFADMFPDDKSMALSAIKRIFDNLVPCISNPNCIEFRSELQLAAFEAGLAFRRISTSYVHAIAHRIGEFYHVPHGKAVSSLLIPVLKATMPVNNKRLSEISDFCGYSESNDEQINAINFLSKIDSLFNQAHIDNSDIKINESDLDDIVIRAQEEAKLTGFPRPFTDIEVRNLIIDTFK